MLCCQVQHNAIQHLTVLECRVSPEAFADQLQSESKPLVIDVRPQREFELAHLTGGSTHTELQSGRRFACWLLHMMILYRSLTLCYPFLHFTCDHVCADEKFLVQHKTYVAAGSLNYPFEESLLHLPHMVKQCQQQTVQANAPGSSAEAFESSLVNGLTPQDHASPAHNGNVNTDNKKCCQRGVVVVCRRGNDSQHIVQSLRGLGVASAVDLIGGLSAWSHQQDTSFPAY